MNLSRKSRQDALDKLFVLKDPISTDPEELAHWAKYLCVLVSGFLEECISDWLESRAKGSSPAFIARYVGRQLYYFQNPEHSKVVDLLNAFDPQWARDVLALDEKYKSAINSIVNNRHQIVHGGSCTVSLRQLRAWYEDAKAFLDKLEEIAR